ncbi:hypothetical protein LIPSTDRAFT_203203 [Lipomyces starkeyi NRRL Y-11557]|uniref:Uncharacterized protein n=1 Tax=Lipomyces starkeyi NRRL Y-11557 TaxID=675824 RepID=A0A1E3PUS0_LIPST|nr:hypothetical protein LIPSTDRAFT_203203 [Lipomyces starkeyi NRRL Y-11557]
MILSKGEPIEEPENDHGELNINETEPLATSRDISTISSISDLGFVIEAMWQVAICTYCKFVVDKALFIDHLKLKHGLDNPKRMPFCTLCANTLFDPILQFYGTEQQRTRWMSPTTRTTVHRFSTQLHFVRIIPITARK